MESILAGINKLRAQYAEDQAILDALKASSAEDRATLNALTASSAEDQATLDGLLASRAEDTARAEAFLQDDALLHVATLGRGIIDTVWSDAYNAMNQRLDNHIKNNTKNFLLKMQPQQAKNRMEAMPKAEWLLLLPGALASRKPEYAEWRSHVESQVSASSTDVVYHSPQALTHVAIQVKATKGRHRLDHHRNHVLGTIKAMVAKCIDTAVGGKPGAVSAQQLFDTCHGRTDRQSQSVCGVVLCHCHPVAIEHLHQSMHRLTAANLARFGGEAFKAIINAVYPRDAFVFAFAAAAAAGGAGGGAGASATGRGRGSKRGRRKQGSGRRKKGQRK